MWLYQKNSESTIPSKQEKVSSQRTAKSHLKSLNYKNNKQTQQMPMEILISILYNIYSQTYIAVQLYIEPTELMDEGYTDTCRLNYISTFL
jgi:hypothetical protein